MSISESLRQAWKEAKKMAEKKAFSGRAKLVIAGREGYGDDDDAKFLSFNVWEKKNMRRIYVNDYKRRAVAYIDLTNDNNITTYTNDSQYTDTINRFMSEYAF